MIANFVLAILCLLVGWVGLWPLRRSAGTMLYHLAAMPAGVMSFSFVIALASVLRIRPSGLAIAIGVAAYTAGLFALSWAFGRGGERRVGWRSFAAFGGVYALLAGAVSLSGLTIVGFDSYSHYELSAWTLADTGQVNWIIMGSRNVLVPALLAGTRWLGGDWTYVAYPLFSLTALALTGYAAWHIAFQGMRRVARAAFTAGTVIVMAVVPAWVFHTLNVHSNMVSAMYLTLGVVSLLSAAGAFRDIKTDDAYSRAACVIAGLAIAGLTLARPDGLAYALQGLLLLFVLHFSGDLDRRAVASVYAGLGFPLLAVYGAAFARLGFWAEDAKLKGTWAAALLVAIAVFAVVTLSVPRIRHLTMRVGRSDLVRIIVLADLAVVGLVAVMVRGQFALAVRYMIANLFFAGGWGMTWIALTVAIVITALFPLHEADRKWSSLLLFVFVQFMAIALAVHGATHPGRIKLTDSFNRAALHILPVAFLYVATYVGRLLYREFAPDSDPAVVSSAMEDR